MYEAKNWTRLVIIKFLTYERDEGMKGVGRKENSLAKL